MRPQHPRPARPGSPGRSTGDHLPDAPTYATVVDTLAASVGRLAALVEPLDEAALTTSAYPSEWTVAQVLSHLGSGSVIFRRRLEDARSGAEPDDGFAPAVWAEWDAKAPTAQAADFLAADADPAVAPDLTLPAEAFIRVVYGRLDPDHSTVEESPTLATLRTMFPGP